MPNHLPEFARPPVVEVALSVQFERLDVTTAQLALVWQRFRDRFPRVEEKPELDAVIERFGAMEKRAPAVRFEVGAMPAPRFWFLNEAGSELVQVQRDRFIRNWRKTEGQPDYPRYERIRASFDGDWETFRRFAAQELQTTLLPNQWEVTYVNIVQSANPGRLDEILSCMGGAFSDAYLSEPEGTEVQYRFILDDTSGKPWGRLHVAAAPAVRTADNEAVVRLALTARGNLPSQDGVGALNALDAGHEAVVRGFASITTHEMHKSWGRTR